MSKITVVGAGAWGTTLAILLAENGHQVGLWVYESDLAEEMKEYRENRRFLPGYPLPAALEITNKVAESSGREIYFFAVPTQHLRGTAKKFAEIIKKESCLICAGKGIEEKTLKLPLQILNEELKKDNLAALSGPNLSAEIAKGLPAAAVVAAVEARVAKVAQACLMAERFRVYTSADVTGVQLGGALKNIIAIAAGVVDGLGLGDNAKAALLVRGMAEITRLGVAMGARTETFFGLSGMGDLVTTCSSPLSRNHYVGEQIAKGRKLKEIISSMKEVAEGVPTTTAARALGHQKKIDLPIIEEVYNTLYQGKDPCSAINELMTRQPKSEH